MMSATRCASCSSSGLYRVALSRRLKVGDGRLLLSVNLAIVLVHLRDLTVVVVDYTGVLALSPFRLALDFIIVATRVTVVVVNRLLVFA